MQNKRHIAIGCDHAGFQYKEQIKKELQELGHEVIDFGTNSADSVDYPDYVHPLAQYINDQKADYGILVCGSGNGVAMTANKYQNIRAALCWNEEVSALARKHNDANILCIPARFVKKEEAEKMTKIFINTEFEGGRHANRVDKIRRIC